MAVVCPPMSFCSCLSISQFITRLTCKVHVQRNQCICKNHSTLHYNCALCQRLSKWASYAYRCSLCHQSYCLHHFIDHNIIFQFCQSKGNEINCTSDKIKIVENDVGSVFVVCAPNVNAHDITIKMVNGHKMDSYIGTKFIRANCLTTLGLHLTRYVQ